MSCLRCVRSALLLVAYALGACGGEPSAPRVASDGAAGDSVTVFDIGVLAGDGHDTAPDGSDAASAVDVAADSDHELAADTNQPVDTATDADSTSAACPAGCDDGVPCTVDVCQAGTCTHNIAPGACYADGACLFAGPHPADPCRLCKPEATQLGLLPAAAGTPCNDGTACTTADACDGASACTGSPAPGCCKSNLDCVSGDPCVSSVCDTSSGKCQSQGTSGCCKGGLCCDLGAGAVKPSGTSCGEAVLATEWACDGAQLRKRTQQPGCDGKDANGCSSDPALGVWTPWATVKSCASGELCVPAAAGGEPGCGQPPECTSANDCNDGNFCTADGCKAGACSHAPAAAGTGCGDKVLATEYQCSSGDPGGKILQRKAISVCDGVATQCPATTKTPLWGPWLPVKTCGFSEVCKVVEPSQPGSCVGAPKCKPGSTCCDAEGGYAAKGTPCGSKVLAQESKCVGTPPGNKVQTRKAVGGCSGSSTTCFEFSTSYYSWGPWEEVASCGAKESCEVQWDGTGICSSKTQCNAGAGCCTADGFYQPKGAACASSASVADSEESCESKDKGGWILERKAQYGCSGSTSSCSYASADLVWGPWIKSEQCKANQACDESFGYVSCVDAGVCAPTSGCCTASGEYAAAGVKCKTSSSPWQTERKCDGSKILKREGWAGCSGKSASCSYGADALVWGDWLLDKDCGPAAVCKGSASYFYCGAP